MKYNVVLQKSEEGHGVSCLALPGCCSQGETEQAAIDSIQDAVLEYLEALEENIKGPRSGAEVPSEQCAPRAGIDGPASIRLGRIR